MASTDLPDRMRAAAETLEEASAKYGSRFPDHTNWNAVMLRREADQVELEEPA